MTLTNSEANSTEPDFLKELVDDQDFDDMLSRTFLLAGLLDPIKVFPTGVPLLSRKFAGGATPRASKAGSDANLCHESRHPEAVAKTE